MKKQTLILLAFVFLSTPLLAQNRFEKVRCDSFQLTADTSRALIYRKHKTGVFDKKLNKFLIKPTKDAIFYYPEVNYYVRVGKKAITPIYIRENGTYQPIENSKPDQLKLTFPHVEVANQKGIVRIQDLFLYDYLDERVVKDSLQEANFRIETEIDLLREGNQLFIKNARFPYIYLAQYDDSYISDFGYERSGIYDLAEKRWLIPPVYESFYRAEGFVFCLRRNVMDVKAGSMEIVQEFSYDIYQEDKGKYNMVMQDILSDEQLGLADIFDCDSAQSAGYEDYYITFKHGKKGLARFSLFRDWGNGEEQPFFFCQRLMDDKYDFILVGAEYNYIVTHQKGEEGEVVLHKRKVQPDGKLNVEAQFSAKKSLIWGTNIEENQLLFADDICYRWHWPLVDSGGYWMKEEPVGIRNELNPSYLNKALGIKTVDKTNYLGVINFKNDSIDPFAIPLKSVVYPGEDSIVMIETEGDGYLTVVYPGPILGYDKSGVYDYRVNDWWIPTDFRRVNLNSQGVLVEVNQRDQETEMALGEIVYSFFDYNDYTVFVGQEAEDLEPYLHYVFDGQIREAFFNCPSETVDQITGHYPEKYYYYRDARGMLSLYGPISNDLPLNTKAVAGPKAFLHYNAYYDYLFYLENDSIYVETYAGTYTVSQNNGKILMLIEDQHGEYEYAIQIIEGSDTSEFKSLGYQQYDNVAEIYRFNDRIIVNEEIHYDDITPNLEMIDLFGWSGDILFKEFDTKSSSIWEKENRDSARNTGGVWVKKTPYYASVKPVSFGYIATTGFYNEVRDAEWTNQHRKEDRTIILDTNYKALSYFDFFDFKKAVIYDEGVSICTDMGCFFVDNSGKAITSAEWDDFQIEGNRVKAIKYKNLEDPWIFDPEDMIEKYEYFDLNP